jgi:hypothetical protein
MCELEEATRGAPQQVTAAEMGQCRGLSLVVELSCTLCIQTGTKSDVTSVFIPILPEIAGYGGYDGGPHDVYPFQPFTSGRGL